MTKLALILSVMAIIVAGVAVSSVAQGGQDAALTNEYCPVTPEEAVDPEIFVEHNGERVFFCCNRCRRKFLADPEAYIASLPQFEKHDDTAPGDGHDKSHGAATDDHGARPHAEKSTDTHDHASDHGASTGLPRGIKFAGKFHPLVVHFPIALIMVALLSEGLFIWRKLPFFSDAARFTVVLGAAGAIAAASLGLIAAAGASYPSDQAWVLGVHRWIGIGVAFVAAAAATLSFAQTKSRRLLIAYRTALVVATALVGLAGHFGATLIYGTDYFTW